MSILASARAAARRARGIASHAVGLRAFARAPAITIVGIGIGGPARLTLEVREALQDCRYIFHGVTSAYVLDAIRAMHPSAELVSKTQFDRHNGYRPRIYRDKAEAVVALAEQGHHVALLEPGSAVVTDQITQEVVSLARSKGIPVRVLPGISAIELVLTELAFDPSDGLQIVQAQKLVLFGGRIQPDTAAIVIQHGLYDTLSAPGLPLSRRERYQQLYEAMAHTIPPDRLAAFLVFPMGSAQPGDVLYFRMGDFLRVATAVSPLSTLFIYPSGTRDAADPGFVARLQSLDTLRGFCEAEDPRAPSDLVRWQSAHDWSRIPEELREQSGLLRRQVQATPYVSALDAAISAQR